MDNTSAKIYWLDNFKGKAEGGVFFRDKSFTDFIKKVEFDKGKVVGIKMDCTSNIEFIFEPKSPKTYDRGAPQQQKKTGFMDRVKEIDKKMNKALNLNQDIGASDKKLLEGIPA